MSQKLLVSRFSTLLFAAGCALSSISVYGQVSSASTAAAASIADLPDAPQAQQAPPESTQQKIEQSNNGKQTKRILFIVPNFRAVSADEKLPPLSAKAKFKLTLQDSFDYSSFVYVGIIAGIGQLQNSYPEFHQGAAGYGRYYWHSLADAVNENAFTEFIIPTATRTDPRYYTLGRGGFARRTFYSLDRLIVTRTDDAGETFNYGEVIGAGAAAGVSNLYYPSQTRTWTKTGQKWLTQVAIDGVSNVAKEFWPDINSKILRNKL